MTKKLKSQGCCLISRKKLVPLLIVGLYAAFLGHKYWGDYEVVRVAKQVRQSITAYHEFHDNKEKRLQRLASLSGLRITPNKEGVYVLVIGESETRDRMGLYGYSRNTTPWLSMVAKEKGTLVFTHAYSNHTHTVPSLTYALSEKNQYNQLNLAEVNSIIEIANAAGMDTYWISNQERYGSGDTPVAEIASTAKHQYWLNNNVGNVTETRYYDGKLVDYMPDATTVNKALIVIHVMGVHGAYHDRYPNSYNQFTGTDMGDEYDNAVAYNDEVLHRIYDKVKDNPYFMGFIFFSDHGEVPEPGIGHESSKFRFAMAHIPLVMHFSDTYMEKNPYTYRGLQKHLHSYWTNDLMYNLLLSVLGIEGAPIVETEYDLTNEEYRGTEANLTTLHGRKRLSEDK